MIGPQGLPNLLAVCNQPHRTSLRLPAEGGRSWKGYWASLPRIDSNRADDPVWGDSEEVRSELLGADSGLIVPRSS